VEDSKQYKEDTSKYTPIKPNNHEHNLKAHTAKLCRHWHKYVEKERTIPFRAYIIDNLR